MLDSGYLHKLETDPLIVTDFFPFGERDPSCVAKKFKGKYLSYDQHFLFLNEQNNQYCSREKVYLDSKAFLNTSFWTQTPQLLRVRDLFTACQAAANDISEKHKPLDTLFDDQLMFIRYSQTCPSTKGSRVFGISHEEQSMAIIEYIEKNWPNPALFPSDSYLAAKVRQDCELINSGIQPMQNLKLLNELDKRFHCGQDGQGLCFVEQGVTGLKHRGRTASSGIERELLPIEVFR